MPPDDLLADDLLAGRVAVTWARPAAIDTALGRVLAGWERERLSRLVRDADRQRYLAAHVLARQVLAQHLDCRPEQVPINSRCPVCGATGHGRPVVEGGPHVSYSHAGGRVAVAVSVDAEIGLDVEDPALIHESFDAAALSATERAYPRWTRAARARCWVRKEAALKAAGVGLTVDPSQVVLSAPGEPARVLRWPLGTPPTLIDLDLGGYPAAVALMSTAALHVQVCHVTRLSADTGLDTRTDGSRSSGDQDRWGSTSSAQASP